MKNLRLFVYGTLKEGFGAHDLLKGCRRILGPNNEEISVPGFMLHFRNYPGLMINTSESRNCKAYGEVYEVTEEILKATDRYESVPSLYVRVVVPSSCGYVNTYFYNNKPIITENTQCVSYGKWEKGNTPVSFRTLIYQFAPSIEPPIVNQEEIKLLPPPRATVTTIDSPNKRIKLL